jgi:hypothetical protein
VLGAGVGSSLTADQEPEPIQNIFLRDQIAGAAGFGFFLNWLGYRSIIGRSSSVSLPKMGRGTAPQVSWFALKQDRTRLGRVEGVQPCQESKVSIPIAWP